MKHEVSNQLTRQALASALRSRLEKKPLSKITVSEIAKDCNLNRKTFYYHFRDIYDLYKWMLEQETIEVVKQFDLLTDRRRVIRVMLNYITENKHLINSAYDAVGSAGLKRFFYEDFFNMVRMYIDYAEKKNGIEVDEDFKNFQCKFFTEALSGMILSWCRDDPECALNCEKNVRYLEEIILSAVPESQRLHMEGSVEIIE